MSAGRRRYRVVDEDTRHAAVATVIAQIEAGRTFTSPCAHVAEQIDVSGTAVRGWVNASGLRPRPAWDEVLELRARLDTALALNRRLSRRPAGPGLS